MLAQEGIVDLRSDTVTRPSVAMREAMAAAPVGDDVYGDDPTVNLLQEEVASLLGKEAGLFMPSGTMSNQVAIKTACRGGEAICEAGAHIFHYEMAAAASRSGIQLYPVGGEGGRLRWSDLEPAIRPATGYFARTGLICLENTHNRAGGTVQPLDFSREIKNRASQLGIPVHLDGARLWNAHVATGEEIAALAGVADTVSVCFSKGLGAPIGSCLCGSKEFVAEARLVRRSFGGGLRQAGVVAAAALYAVRNNIGRLEEDHRRAKALAAGVGDVGGFDVLAPETNIVMIDVLDDRFGAAELAGALARRGILVNAVGPRRLRAVTHLDVDDAQVARAVVAFRDCRRELVGDR